MFGLFRVLPESMHDKERGGADNRTESHERVPVQREPDDPCQKDRYDGKEPDTLGGEEPLPPEAEILGLQKQPVEEEEDQERPAANQEDGS